MEKYYRKWLNILKDELNSYDAILVIYVGQRGSGKSYAALSDAIHLDPTFTSDQIGFLKSEIDELITKYEYQGRKVLIWEEFGAEMFSRNWFKQLQKAIIQRLQVIRETEVSLFLTLPHVKFGDTMAEQLANFEMELQRPQFKQDCYRMGRPLQPYGFYSARKLMQFRVFYLEGEIWHVPYLDPSRHNPELFAEYHQKKREYIAAQLELEEEEETVRLTKKQARMIELRNQGVSIRGIVEEMKVEGYGRITRSQVETAIKNGRTLGLIEFEGTGQRIATIP